MKQFAAFTSVEPYTILIGDVLIIHSSVLSVCYCHHKKHVFLVQTFDDLLDKVNLGGAVFIFLF